jgi:hypothetical protein
MLTFHPATKKTAARLEGSGVGTTPEEEAPCPYKPECFERS